MSRMRVQKQKLSTGWDEARVRRVLGHYEEQSEVEATAEDEAALKVRDQTLVEIPNDLLPEIRSLIAKHQTRT